MFDDDFKCDFKDMEGLSLNSDAFSIFNTVKNNIKLASHLSITENPEGDFNEMNNLLTFLIQDKSDLEEMLGTIKNSAVDEIGRAHV